MAFPNRQTKPASISGRRGYGSRNSNDPSPGNVTEEKESELDEFIDYAMIIVGSLGHKMFEKLVEEYRGQL